MGAEKPKASGRLAIANSLAVSALSGTLDSALISHYARRGSAGGSLAAVIRAVFFFF